MSPSDRLDEKRGSQDICLAPSLLYQITFARWNEVNASKSITRIVRDFVPRFVTGSFTAAQIQWIAGPNKEKFIAWGKSNKIPIVVEDIGEDATLLWMGEKRTDRVVLYLHGENGLYWSAPLC